VNLRLPRIGKVGLTLILLNEARGLVVVGLTLWAMFHHTT
jgi:hypothetical protein